MATATATPPPQTLSMQGIEVPSSSVDKAAFFKNTRRLRFKQQAVASIQGFGQTDTFVVKQTGIIAAIDIKVFGNLTVAIGTGTVASTSRWPYDLLKKVRLSANGQSNLINVSGLKLRAREFMSVGDLNDRGVVQGMTGASPGVSTNQGTLAIASESWGVGQNVSAIPSAVYDVEISLRIPVAWDNVKLIGSIFAQTASTSLQVDIDWESLANLFTLTGNAAVTQNFSAALEGVVFSIPEVAGQIVVPDLSVFHSMVQNNDFTLGSGAESELTLQGQGVGRQLMRTFFQVWNGAAPQVPIALNAANWGTMGWRYGGNDTPEVYMDGRSLRFIQEKLFSTDLGAQGIACFDFASQWAFRDSIDEGTATNLRLAITCLAALTAARTEIVQETIFAGTTGS